MADSLRDQLLKSGLVQKLKVEVKPTPAVRPGGGKPHSTRHNARAKAAHHADHKPRSAPSSPAKTAEELDLARAYALRAREEKLERERLDRAAAEQARLKKERKQKIVQLIAGKALNDAAAEQPRHFTHGDKIRRVYCTPEQLARLNRGELGVVQHGGRYLLVDRDTALAVQALEAAALVLLPDPDAASDDDIPPDLIW